MLRSQWSSGAPMCFPRWRAAFLVTFLCACADSTSPRDISPRVVRPEMVTGAAALALGSEGRFQLPLPNLPSNSVDLDTARTQALEFAKYATNEILFRGAIEESRGGYWTDPHLLNLCPQDAYFVRPQLDPVLVDTLPPNVQAIFQRIYGPQWLIAFCGSQIEPQMTVQVAVSGNAIRFVNAKPVEPYYSIATAFFGRGVPLNWPDVLPISAERAVRYAYDQLGVPVSAVPELVVRGSMAYDTYTVFQAGSARYCNRWRIGLARDVAVHGLVSQTVQTMREVWVGAASCRGTDVFPVLQIPFGSQPSELTLEFIDNTSVPVASYTVHAPVVFPVHFELAEKGTPP